MNEETEPVKAEETKLVQVEPTEKERQALGVLHQKIVAAQREYDMARARYEGAIALIAGVRGMQGEVFYDGRMLRVKE